MRQDVMEVIDSEVEFARGWDKVSTDLRPQRDADKSAEFWVLHMERYIQKAREACSGVDKVPVMENIRKLAALCVRAMENIETPKREGELKPY